LKLLNESAQKVFYWLISQAEFSAVMTALMEEYEAARSSTSPQPPRFNSDRPEFSNMAAENVINDIRTLPAHYLFAPFWNFASAQLLPFRNRSEFDPLHGARGKLREISSVLKQGLEDQRLSFSRKFDIPAAPIPGLSLEV
jgi:hypothetical protein